jgi:tetratricopeptide (TPR) repeat protein
LIPRGLRELGRFGDAIAFGLAAKEHTTSHMVWLGLAGTYQKVGASAQAKAAFVCVSELEPEDPRVRVDLGDLCLDEGEPAEASRWYREALVRDPQNAWAIASEQYTAFVLAKDRAMLADLRALAVAGNERAARLFDRAEAFEIDLFPPKSAAVDGALDAGRRGLTPERIVCVDYEAPSAIQAAREIVGLPADATLGVTFEHMPVPDPREPEQAVAHTLWTLWEPGFFARLRPLREVGAPALAAPADAVNDVVRSLARTRYSPQGWYRAGQDQGRTLWARAVGSLPGAMVRPVPFAKEPFRASESFTWAPHEWRFRLIVAAAFLVAGVDQGWKGSKRSGRCCTARWTGRRRRRSSSSSRSRATRWRFTKRSQRS